MSDINAPDPELAADLLALATQAAARAAAFLVEGWSGREVVSTKSSGTDVVTQMDRGSESLLVETIIGQRPEDSARRRGRQPGRQYRHHVGHRSAGRDGQLPVRPARVGGQRGCAPATGRSSVWFTPRRWDRVWRGSPRLTRWPS